MTKDQVQAYIDNEVQKMGDARVRPLVQSINVELVNIRNNDASKAAIDKNTEEINKRIAVLQTELGKAKVEVEQFAVKLAEATVTAANS